MSLALVLETANGTQDLHFRFGVEQPLEFRITAQLGLCQSMR